MKKVVIGLSAIIMGGLLLLGTLYLPQRNPFEKKPPETSPVKTEKTDVTENNLTISDCLRGYSTLKEFEKDVRVDGYADKAYIVALDNKGEPGGWMVSTSGKNDQLMGGESKNGVITDPVYANDPDGATVGDIKKALSERDEKFSNGTLIPNMKNNRTMFFMVDTYKTKKAFERWYKNEKITPNTRIMKTLYYGVVIDQTEVQGTFYDLKTDSNAITVSQILKAFP
jgi:hypothetical protein